MAYTNSKYCEDFMHHLSFFAGTVSNGLSAFSKKMKVSSVLEKGNRFKVFGRVMKRLDRSDWIRNTWKNKGGCT